MKSALRFTLLLTAALFWLAGSQPARSEEKQSMEQLPTSTDFIVPAEIRDPLKTWYMGRIALDMPEAINSKFPKVRIYPDDSRDTVDISFFEEIDAPSGENYCFLTDPIPLLRDKLIPSARWGAKKIATEDLSALLGRPAGLIIYFGPDYQREERPILGFDILVKEKRGCLKFAYTELLDDSIALERQASFFLERKKHFVNWLTGFLSAYRWTGRNDPPAPNQLATLYGHINLENGWPAPKIIIAANYSLVSRPGDFISISVVSDYLKPHSPAPASPGKSDLLDIAFSPKGTEDILIWKDWPHYVDSETYGRIPVEVKLMARIAKDDRDFQSYLMGACIMAEKSIRLMADK